MSRKKILWLLLIVGTLFLLSGCTIPTDPTTGRYVEIGATTTFGEMMSNEGVFSAIFVYPVAMAINWIAPFFPKEIGAGLAIMIVVAIINIAVLALTFKSNLQQQKMTEIQPEITKITKKYEGKTDEASKMRQAQETQAIYKKYDINIFGTLLSTFIQFPVLIAVYQAVQRSSVVLYGEFLGLSLETTPLAGITSGQWGYILLFTVMLITQIGSLKIPTFLANRDARKEAELHHRKFEPVKQAGGNMMYIMMIVMMVLAISWPAAMTFYWIISSIITIAKTIVVKQIMKRQKAQAALKV